MTHFSDANGSQYKDTKSDILLATPRNHLFGSDRKRPVCSRYICTHYC